MPQIKQDILENLEHYAYIPRVSKIRAVIPSGEEYLLKQDHDNTITLDLPQSSTIVRCIATTNTILVECSQNNSNTLDISISKKDDSTLGDKLININLTTQGAQQVNLRTLLKVDRLSDRALALTQAKEQYLTQHTPPTPSTSEKFKNTISLSHAKTLAQQPIKVLLYDLSTSKDTRDFFCQNCEVYDQDNTRYTDKSFSVANKGSHLEYTNSNTTTEIQELSIIPNNKEGTTIVLNYERASYAGIPRNSFYGSINISRQDIKNIDRGSLESRYVLINTLPLDLYMRGIAETNDAEPFEKNKVMSLLAKNYVLFYLDDAHNHPSVPQGAAYNAIDDARSFQKYVGA